MHCRVAAYFSFSFIEQQYSKMIDIKWMNGREGKEAGEKYINIYKSSKLMPHWNIYNIYRQTQSQIVIRCEKITYNKIETFDSNGNIVARCISLWNKRNMERQYVLIYNSTYIFHIWMAGELLLKTNWKWWGFLHSTLYTGPLNLTKRHRMCMCVWMRLLFVYLSLYVCVCVRALCVLI
jgi:hypothetical protein